MNRNLNRSAAAFEANYSVVWGDGNQCGNLLSGHFWLHTVAFFELATVNENVRCFSSWRLSVIFIFSLHSAPRTYTLCIEVVDVV